MSQSTELTASLTTAPASRASDALNSIAVIDLGPIRYKLAHDPDGEQWPLAKVSLVEAQYRAYLALVLMYPDRAIVPSREIDTFWHAHILDTRKYERDCMTAFGRFLHHFPYFGLRGAADAESLEQAFAETRDLFRTHFSIDPSAAADCYSGSCGTACGARCSDPGMVMQPSVRPSLGMDGSVRLSSDDGSIARLN